MAKINRAVAFVLLKRLANGDRVLVVDTAADEVRRIVMEECRKTLHPYGFCFACPTRKP